MSRTNETRHIEWNETCKCKCGLDARVCNNKRRWNNENVDVNANTDWQKNIWYKIYLEF